MTRRLPAHASLEHLRKQAKALLRGLQGADPVALERYRAQLGHPAPASPKLADAQLALARDYGFASWPGLKAHLESAGREADPVGALVAAVKANDPAAARAALERHPQLRRHLDEPMEGFGFGATPLLAAVSSGSRAMVDLLLDAGAGINQRSHWWAGGFGVLDGDRALAAHLIERGARVDAHAAAHLGMFDALAALIEADPAVVHARGGDGQTPLHVARDARIAQLLLAHGAEPDALDVDHESTPAQYLVRESPDVARLLVEHGARTDLLMCAALGDLERARRQLDADPATLRMDVSARWFPMRDPRAGGTIYIWTLGANKSAHVIAREFGHEPVLELLLERSPDGLRLALACELGDEPAFRELRAGRPDLAGTLTDEDRRRLAVAAQNNNADAVRLMLEAGWPLDARGQHGGTALHWAAWHGNVAMVRELLRRRARVDARDADHDQSPLGWAVHGSEHGWQREAGDYGATVEALLGAGASPGGLLDEPAGSAAVQAALRRHAARR